MGEWGTTGGRGGASHLARLPAPASAPVELVRTAALLTGDPAVAGRLAEEAVVRGGPGDPREQLHWVVRASRLVARRRRGGPGQPWGGLSLASAPELQELAAVLGLLPERLRTPLVLRYFCDLPVGAVADALGWRQAVVEARLGQALARLRGLLEL
ncbi:sigma factor-like helix-turn-helix DNA-binding protein [Aciditerrimonas ferrireducens]|uniref:sigma factor-like helix-turn-helix DNA-binding protein n=1 Tax=Aciditerrimonas ferrireducens TaxID=667306 RepID=UPI002004C71C|nr:sigma factor-like helix-turn-helix DNA-binding protein [Aciditerrimonas ferrireducens]MCK4177037.1 hypothetical protein [Aciditerrimonas ferrireducens]